MQTERRPTILQRGMTLLEMTIVLLVLLTLMGMGIFASRKYTDWRKGRAASESLRDVYTAQRMYLADNPTATVASLTAAVIIPYLPNSATALPVVQSLTGATLGINVAVSPPVFTSGAAAYDPSGSLTDSLWDVGE